MVRLTDRPDMTLDVYRGRKTTIQPTTFTLQDHKTHSPVENANEFGRVFCLIGAANKLMQLLSYFSSYPPCFKSLLFCTVLPSKRAVHKK